MKKSTVQIRSAIQGLDVSLWAIAAMFAPKGWKRRTCVTFALLIHLSSWAEISWAAKQSKMSVYEYIMEGRT